MYTVSDEVLRKIETKFKEELCDRDYDYEIYAIEKIMDEWLKAKQNLFDLLSKHPLWNPEKLMIAFDQDYDRKLELRELGVFCDWLYSNAHVNPEIENVVDEADRIYSVISWIP